jgi:hypothetical protein
MAIIQGTNGNDILTGGTDDDRIIGSAGNDIITGGGDRDLFVLGDRNGAYYVGQGNNDYAMITDFNLRQDSLDLGNAKNISFGIESAGTIDLFSGTDPSSRDLIAKIQLKGGFPKIEREYQMGIGDRNTRLSGNLLANGGVFSSDNMGSQFDIIMNGSDFVNTRQT